MFDIISVLMIIGMIYFGFNILMYLIWLLNVLAEWFIPLIACTFKDFFKIR